MRLIQRPAALLLLLAWLPLIPILFPLPTAENAERVTHGMSEFFGKSVKDAREYLDTADRKNLEDAFAFWQDTESIQSLWLRGWTISLAVILVGVVASIMAIANLPSWRLVVLASALLYFAMMFKISATYIPSWQNAQKWWMIATQLNNGFFVVYRELIFPFFQAMIFVAMLSLVVTRINVKGRRET